MSGKFSYVIREIGRPAVFFLGAASNVAAVAVLFCWQPEPGEEWVLYAVAALWAVGDAVWQTQVWHGFPFFKKNKI